MSAPPRSAVAGRLHVLQDQAPGARRAHAHARLGLDGDAGGPGLDDEQRRAGVVQRGGDHEQLGVRRARHQRLDAVEHVAAAGGAGRGRQVEGVEQRLGLHQRQRGRRDVVADERRQVGGLLLGVAPQADGRRDRGGGQAGGGDAHVTLGQRLAHQHRRGGRALLHGAAQLLGDADHGQPQLVGLGEQLGRRGAGGVGVQRGGAQALGAELADRVSQEGLLVGGGQVE